MRPVLAIFLARATARACANLRWHAPEPATNAGRVKRLATRSSTFHMESAMAIAKPYREGKTWSVRVRRNGDDIYLPGFASPRAAEEAMRQELAALGLDAGRKHGSITAATPSSRR